MYCTQEELEAAREPALTPQRADLAKAIAAHAFGVTLEEMRTETHGHPHTALARQVAMYLSHIVFGMTMSEVAHAFLRHKTTAHHALRRIEGLRDDAEFDRSLYRLEATLRSAAGRAA
jgi:chromosomal replication initiation ATPase DnaA